MEYRERFEALSLPILQFREFHADMLGEYKIIAYGLPRILGSLCGNTYHTFLLPSRPPLFKIQKCMMSG